MEMWHIRILYVNKYTPEFHSCCEVNQITQIMLSSISDSIGHKIVGKKICQKKKTIHKLNNLQIRVEFGAAFVKLLFI